MRCTFICAKPPVNRCVLSTILSLALTTGCITRAGGALDPIDPVPPPVPGLVEETVGDFAFTLEGGKMVSSAQMGRELNNEIFKHWKKKGYIEDYEFVDSGSFSGNADYNVTLSGSQYGDSSIVEQFFSGLTLLLIPHTVNTHFDIQYRLHDVRTGSEYAAQVEDSYHATIELFLFLAAPVAFSGRNQTLESMADHLYEQLRAQGAFATTSGDERATQ